MPHLFTRFFNIKMQKSKILETSLVLTTGFLLIFMITGIRIFLILAFSLGIIGIFIQPLAKIIAVLWFKLADILNFFVPKIVLGALFFLILFPVSFFYRMLNKDKLLLKRSEKSIWVERNKNYSAYDFENTW